ncbi:MAG: hypothetical protein H7123_04010 [Thermoleophilia bacterium]|nr:hypothetical protein [Thermoleophilia bacterium]
MSMRILAAVMAAPKIDGVAFTSATRRVTDSSTTCLESGDIQVRGDAPAISPGTQQRGAARVPRRGARPLPAPTVKRPATTTYASCKSCGHYLPSQWLKVLGAQCRYCGDVAWETGTKRAAESRWYVMTNERRGVLIAWANNRNAIADAFATVLGSSKAGR